MENSNLISRNFSFENIASTLSKRWYIIISVIACSLLIGILLAFVFVSTTYSASAKLYIINKENPTMTSSEFVASTYLASDISVIISDTAILDDVAAYTDYKYTPNQIRKFISVENIDNTRVLELKVTTDNPNDSKVILAGACKVVQEKVLDIIGADRISVIYNNKETPKQIAENRLATIVKCLLVGILASVFVTAAFALSNNKIISENDIKDLLGMSILAVVPYNDKKSQTRGQTNESK